MLIKRCDSASSNVDLFV